MALGDFQRIHSSESNLEETHMWTPPLTVGALDGMVTAQDLGSFMELRVTIVMWPWRVTVFQGAFQVDGEELIEGLQSSGCLSESCFQALR